MFQPSATMRWALRAMPRAALSTARANSTSISRCCGISDFPNRGRYSSGWKAFNTFNHAQFFGPASVEGNVDNALFGQVIKAQQPRLLQLALKFVY